MMDKLYQYVSTKENVGINLCRISIAIVFMWIGLLKFIPYEADSIVPFVANSPFMSFFYNDPSNYTQFMNHEGELIEANRAWPYLSGAGRLVLKDTIMMAAGLIAMVHSAKCILAQNQHERDYTGKVSAGLR